MPAEQLTLFRPRGLSEQQVQAARCARMRVSRTQAFLGHRHVGRANGDATAAAPVGALAVRPRQAPPPTTNAAYECAGRTAVHGG
jgi:hypothetical protein